MKKLYLILGIIVLIIILFMGYYLILNSPKKKVDRIIQNSKNIIVSCVNECEETGEQNRITEGCVLECENEALAELITEYSKEERLEFMEISGTEDPLIELRTCWENCRYGEERAYYKDCITDCF